MYLKFDEDLYNKIVAITTTDYEKYGEFVPVENVLPMIQDLVHEIDNLIEKQEEFKQEVEDNYRPISYGEQVGFNEKDFYKE